MDVGIISTGVYLPHTVRTFSDFVSQGAEPGLLKKWGVNEHRVAVGETATDMEAKAALDALKKAGMDPLEVDLIIGSCLGFEKANPPNIALTQYKIGAKNAAAFEVDLACAGAIPSMMIADLFVKSGKYRNILLVASCWLNEFIDYTNPAVYAVVGDGASAALVSEVGGESGFIDANIDTNGKYWSRIGIEKRKLFNPQFGADVQERLIFYMDMKIEDDYEFISYAREAVPRNVNALLERTRTAIDDVDWVCPHQNTKTVSGKWIELMGIPDNKVIFTNHRYGNLGPANLWVNLDEGFNTDKIKKGDLILFISQGSGTSTASLLMRM